MDRQIVELIGRDAMPSERGAPPRRNRAFAVARRYSRADCPNMGNRLQPLANEPCRPTVDHTSSGLSVVIISADL